MKVSDRFHLTYCSNIHAAERWPEVSATLAGALPRIRALLNAEGPFAIGLRLSARAAEELDNPACLTTFREFLRDGNYYVPTINGFPYGAFHGQRVKERVYLPDWRSPERLRYTNRLASLLAALLADRSEIEGSVSTAPGAFKAAARSAEDARAIARAMLSHAAYLTELQRRTGVTITLAVEPEPACLIETINEAVAFFRQFLFDAGQVRAASLDSGVAMTVEDVRRHLGLCCDACHMAVEFEDPSTAFANLRAAGIRVNKIQISSALRIVRPALQSAGREALAAFAEDTYLHQVVEQSGGSLQRFVDLPDALASPDPIDADADREWRVHFHVPVFLAAMREFETTQAYLVSVIDLLKRQDICQCLEVETYTWAVLPPEYRTGDVHSAIARELQWVLAQLQS